MFAEILIIILIFWIAAKPAWKR